jgi:hypothetical protein
VGDREIMEAYLNSAPKSTSETDIFPHGTKSLLTSVICPIATKLKSFVGNAQKEKAMKFQEYRSNGC